MTVLDLLNARAVQSQTAYSALMARNMMWNNVKIVAGNFVTIVASRRALSTGIVPAGSVHGKLESICLIGASLYTTCIIVLLGLVLEQRILLPGMENYAQ